MEINQPTCTLFSCIKYKQINQMSTIKKLKYAFAYINSIHSNHASVHYDLTQAKVLLKNAIKKEAKYIKHKKRSRRSVVYGASTGIIKNGY